MTVLSGNDDDANQKTELTPGTLKNLVQIVEPVAKDGGSQLNINTMNVAGNVYLNIPSKDANVMVVYSDVDEIPRADTRRLMIAANDSVPSITEREGIKAKIAHRMVA